MTEIEKKKKKKKENKKKMKKKDSNPFVLRSVIPVNINDARH